MPVMPDHWIRLGAVAVAGNEQRECTAEQSRPKYILKEDVLCP
jgi:hypothetical protein